MRLEAVARARIGRTAGAEADLHFQIDGEDRPGRVFGTRKTPEKGLSSQSSGFNLRNQIRQVPAGVPLNKRIPAKSNVCHQQRGIMNESNKKIDIAHPLGIGVGEPHKLDADVLADHRKTRQYLMEQCGQMRKNLGLEAITLQQAEEESP